MERSTRNPIAENPTAETYGTSVPTTVNSTVANKELLVGNWAADHNWLIKVGHELKESPAITKDDEGRQHDNDYNFKKVAEELYQHMQMKDENSCYLAEHIFHLVTNCRFDVINNCILSTGRRRRCRAVEYNTMYYLTWTPALIFSDIISIILAIIYGVKTGLDYYKLFLLLFWSSFGYHMSSLNP